MILSVLPEGFLVIGDKQYRCALGRSGIIKAAKKCEGDGATPAGNYRLRALYYRSDKFPEPPATGLPVFEINRNDGWCDDPADNNYNKQVKLPCAARHEAMWRDDDLYDLVVVIGHNDDPVVPHKGSCIFMHLAKPGYAPTEGCVALSRDDLLAVLKECSPETEIHIAARPEEAKFYEADKALTAKA